MSCTQEPEPLDVAMLEGRELHTDALCIKGGKSRFNGVEQHVLGVEVGRHPRSGERYIMPSPHLPKGVDH